MCFKKYHILICLTTNCFDWCKRKHGVYLAHVHNKNVDIWPKNKLQINISSVLFWIFFPNLLENDEIIMILTFYYLEPIVWD